MEFENYFLNPAFNLQTKIVGCRSCGHKMEWVMHSINNLGVGMNKPSCIRCGSKETVEM